MLPALLPTLFGAPLWPLYAAWLTGLLGAALVDLHALLGVRLEITARIPPAAEVGEPVRIPLTIRMHGSPGLSARLRTETTLPLEPGPDIELRLDSDGADGELLLAAPRRGKGSLEAVWCRLVGPLGLLARVLRVSQPEGSVVISPSLTRIRRLALEHLGAWRYRGGVRLTVQRGVGTEFDALEGYQSGMDLRHVDWKASARHQALQMRRFRLEQNQRIVVSLDTGRLMADPIGGMQRLDHGIHAALLLAWFALRDGDLVGLHAYGARPELWVPPRGGQRQLHGLIGAAGMLQPRDVETNHVLGMHDLFTRLGRRTLVVVLTELADPTTAELMVENLWRLARQHQVIFVALDDPVLEEAFQREPSVPADLALSVAASGLRRDRQTVLRRLAGQGVHVVSGPPGQAARRLVKCYSEIKQRKLIG